MEQRVHVFIFQSEQSLSWHDQLRYHKADPLKIEKTAVPLHIHVLPMRDFGKVEIEPGLRNLGHGWKPSAKYQSSVATRQDMPAFYTELFASSFRQAGHIVTVGKEIAPDSEIIVQANIIRLEVQYWSGFYVGADFGVSFRYKDNSLPVIFAIEAMDRNIFYKLYITRNTAIAQLSKSVNEKLQNLLLKSFKEYLSDPKFVNQKFFD